MIYQLPSGKIVTISVEQYLELTDEDIEFLVSTNAGTYANSPFYGTAMKGSKKNKSEDVDKSIDYSHEIEEIVFDDIDINRIIELEDLKDSFDL